MSDIAASSLHPTAPVLPRGCRVFVNAMNGLGDFLLILPTLHQLKLHLDARITVLLWYYLEDMGRAIPYLDRFLVWNEEYRSEEGFQRLCGLVADSGPYDLSLDFAFPPRSALVSEASRAPLKLQIMPAEPMRPGIERVARLEHHGIMVETWRVLDRLGVPRPSAPPPLRMVFQGADFTTARELTAEFSPGVRRILIHPGAGVAARRWAPEKIAELADRLADRYHAEVMFLGGRANQMSIISKQRGENEEDDVSRILALCRRRHQEWPRHQECPRHLSAAGRDTTRSLALLMEQCDLVIGHNSGPAHLAGQLGCRTLALWGASDPREWSPVGENVEIAWNVDGLDCAPCSPSGCDDPLCMKQLTVEHVLAAIERRWPGLPPTPRTSLLGLEVASGERPQEGYLHLDRRVVAGVNVVGDVAKPPLAGNRFRQVHAQHIIEHFPRAEVGDVLRRWVEMLAPGGSILVVTPNLAYIADGYRNGTMTFGEATTRLYGEQNYVGNTHYHLFDRDALMTAMRDAGCDAVYDLTPRYEKRAIPMSLYVVGFRAR